MKHLRLDWNCLPARPPLLQSWLCWVSPGPAWLWLSVGLALWVSWCATTLVEQRIDVFEIWRSGAEGKGSEK